MSQSSSQHSSPNQPQSQDKSQPQNQSQPQNHGAIRVVRVERAACVVLAPDGPRTVSTAIALAVGDWVTLDPTGRVERVMPRHTEIGRTSVDGRSTRQVLAANVDVVAVCTPLERGARPGRTERFLALAWSSGARPLLVATKTDLCPPGDIEPALAELAAIAPGVDVVAVTIDDPVTLRPLRSAIAPDRTLVMLGASGVGKSSLINALLGSSALATTEIRDDGKGRHTTAWRELVELPGGGYLIDTPGLRAVGLSDARDGVEAVFADVGTLAAECRFHDCGHNGEPGCRVAQAIADGELDPARLERARKLQRELDYQERRHDARARAEYTRQWVAKVRNNRAPRT